MERTQEIALTQMRKSVEKLGSCTQRYGDPTLMRFLIARSMDPEKAAKMFVQWQKWRAAFVPNGFIPDSEVQNELETRKIYLQGLSKERNPVLIAKANKHFPSKDHLQFKKFVVHLLDKAIASAFKGREIGNEKLVVVLDLQQITYRNIDVRGFAAGFQFLQAYYPERLAKFFILNMPRFFISVWKMISRFLEKATLEKGKIHNYEKKKNLQDFRKKRSSYAVERQSRQWRKYEVEGFALTELALSREGPYPSLFFINLNTQSPLPQMEKTREIAVSQMRKSVEKLGSSTESYGDTSLMRFLIARSMDPEKAAKMFVQCRNGGLSLFPMGLYQTLKFKMNWKQGKYICRV
ncbi:hypothetical protein GH714_002059 [Hevea brasiliensis]|uniref:CRAL-TRIO domain-containing protein n=1 Tax=Hevea brasiliensis TaxID=3981 RepID=A0A6A6MGP3_HEVBR|nr:hypothetical protein GH714_002059 [Hevea brasiliensis]